ncbi:type I restriction enzyme endonuclease domain-containing protein, partial [Vibrio parahaemolyticus]|uniref:type I restriction enzyme endonuclease domain-containing protein n=1 Tax=Vibrio parahaemolyticus TaxID=670 RepID=UPI00146E0DB4
PQSLERTGWSDFKRVNRLKGVDFSGRLQSLVDQYNGRREGNELRGEEFEPFVDEMFDGIIKEMTSLMSEMVTELTSFEDLGIDMEEKAFLDILEHMRTKYEFE